MAAELKDEAQLEIGHVLFMDIVGFSKLLVDEQSEFSDRLNQIVRKTEQFRAADEAGKLIRLPTGDGMVLVFFTSPEAPARCALEIGKALKNDFGLRMGIHSGPVNKIVDVDGRTNLAGGGINTAQRVMDCGDAGHILLSKRVADDLGQYGRWRGRLYDLGEVEVKHGARVGLVNLYTEEVGNSQVPEKVKLAQRQARAAQTRALRNRRRFILFAALGAAAASLAGFFLWPRVAAGKLDRSIAILPFQNLSADKENAYFAGGIQDEILTNLAKIGDLKVISRTSVMRYAGSQQSVREIAQALGVTAVLEGSVRRSGNLVHITAQLINAINDDHIWAENYERDITDAFGVQRDVALDIAAALHAKLSPNEKERIEGRPTKSGEAYLSYLQAQDKYSRSQEVDDLKQVAELYERAIQRDPEFALAFARLAYIQALLYHNNSQPTTLEKARDAANKAIKLEPALPEAHQAQGYVYYWGDHDYEKALAELAIAKAGLPNNADVLGAIAAIERRQGKWSDSTANFEKQASLDPKDPYVLAMGAGGNYWATRNFPAAAKILDRAIKVDPSFIQIHLWRAQLDIDWKEDLSALEKLLAHPPTNADPDGAVTFAQYQTKLFQRRYGEAVEALEKSPRETFEDWDTTAGGMVPKSLLRAQAYRLANDIAKANSSFQDALQILEKAVQENPLTAARHVLLGKVYAGLGRKDEAIREGKRAVELLPENKDALDGPKMSLGLARIYTMVGDANSALPLIEHCLSAPGPITVALLKLDPVWDPLRKDPRFQKLLIR
jgi:TolB-like protein/class 3 adenylate cyclase/predicted Zn-dependent protease